MLFEFEDPGSWVNNEDCFSLIVVIIVTFILDDKELIEGDLDGVVREMLPHLWVSDVKDGATIEIERERDLI